MNFEQLKKARKIILGVLPISLQNIVLPPPPPMYNNSGARDARTDCRAGLAPGNLVPPELRTCNNHAWEFRVRTYGYRGASIYIEKHVHVDQM